MGSFQRSQHLLTHDLGIMLSLAKIEIAGVDVVLGATHAVQSRGKWWVVCVNTPTLVHQQSIRTNHANCTSINQAGEHSALATLKRLLNILPTPILACLGPFICKVRLPLTNALNRRYQQAKVLPKLALDPPKLSQAGIVSRLAAVHANNHQCKAWRTKQAHSRLSRPCSQ